MWRSTTQSKTFSAELSRYAGLEHARDADNFGEKRTFESLPVASRILKGGVDRVNSLPYYPIELGVRKDIEAVFGKESKEAETYRDITSRAVSKDGIHYHGSAKVLGGIGVQFAEALLPFAKK